MDWLPAEIAPATGALLVAASLATSMLTAAFGIGGGIALLALMASVMPPAALIPIHGVVQLGSNAGRAALMIRETAVPVLLPFGAGAAIGAFVGGAVVVDLPPAVLEVSIGLFILASLFARVPQIRGATPVVGALTSLVGMFVGATGPFIAAFLRQAGLPRTAFVATLAVLMSLQHLVKIAAFGLFGFAFGPWIGLAAAMIATGFVGTLIGRHILLRIDEKRFGRVVTALLALLALRLVLTGGIDLAGA